MHEIKDYKHLVRQLPGFSEKQLTAHFGLYEGYVKKLNEIESLLKSANPASSNYSYGEISELHRRHSVAFNGAVLHELYFENLSANGGKPSTEFTRAIESDFGSLDQWYADATACLISSPGWCLLTRSRVDGHLRNCLIEEHHRGLLAEQDILIALDGWEHAYMIDYSTAKKSYTEALKQILNWEAINQRFERVRSLEWNGLRSAS